MTVAEPSRAGTGCGPDVVTNKGRFLSGGGLFNGEGVFAEQAAKR
jgi:hypothetical protein